MRLLVLTPEAPDPQGGGGAIRTLHLARRLVELGHDIRIVAPAYADQAARVGALAGEGLRSRLVARPASQGREAVTGLVAEPALLAAVVRDPWLGLQAGVFWSALRRAVLDEIARERPDAVLVEHDFAAAWALDLPADLPAALVLHNATWRLYADMASERSGAAAALYRLEATRYQRFVRRCEGRYGFATVVSEADRRAWTQVSDAPVAVVPNGVDVRRFPRTPPEPAGTQLLFTGTMSYPPNAEAVRWFCEQVLPRVRAVEPRAELTILGRGAPPSVARLDGREGVRVAGWVDDVAPYFARANVVVAPLRTGGGTKLKVLEAMAAGRPIVATRVATAGIDVADGVEVLEADEPMAFADAVLLLLRDPARGRVMGEAGRRLVQDRYDWRACGDSLNDGLLGWLRSR